MMGRPSGSVRRWARPGIGRAPMLGLAVWACAALAEARQAPPPIEGPQAPPIGGTMADPSLRYRFIESYGDPRAPGDGIGAFRVASIETRDQSIEAPGAAPISAQLVARLRYLARPALVAGRESERVPALVRTYQEIQLTNEGVADDDPDGIAGLGNRALWFSDDGGPSPTVLTLGPGRPLTENQYSFVAFDQIYVPKLAGLLPTLHTRVGEGWRVQTEAAEALVGNRILDGTLEGRLVEIRPPAGGDDLSTAIFRISGRLELLNTRAAINAEVQFAFQGGRPDPVAGGIRTLDPTLIDVHGAIVRLLLAQREIALLPSEDGRSAPGRATLLRNLNLERRLGLDGAPPPALPSAPIEKTDANSWVLYRDPEGRFNFRHPQEYRPVPFDAGSAEGAVHLQRPRIGGSPDDLDLEFRVNVLPETFTRELVQGWNDVNVQVGNVNEGFMPENDWPGRRVYRTEATLGFSPEAFAVNDSGRAYFSAYLVQYPRDATLELKAISGGKPNTFRTEAEEIGEFRREVEAILKSVTLDPSDAASNRDAPPAGTVPPAGAGAGSIEEPESVVPPPPPINQGTGSIPTPPPPSR